MPQGRQKLKVGMTGKSKETGQKDLENRGMIEEEKISIDDDLFWLGESIIFSLTDQ